jgi:hypothetical protein
MPIHDDQVMTPYELCFGRKPDVSRLHTLLSPLLLTLVHLVSPSSRSDAVDFRRLPLYLQLSQPKRIQALHNVSGERDSALMSATVVALEDAYTDAD